SQVRARLDGRSGHSRRPGLLLPLAGLTALVIAGATIRGRHHNPVKKPEKPQTQIIVPSGEPVDWTNTSRVLATIDDRLRCLVMLPDHHTLRFALGIAPRCEDLDTITGRRTSSPLVDDA